MYKVSKVGNGIFRLFIVAPELRGPSPSTKWLKSWETPGESSAEIGCAILIYGGRQEIKVV